MKPIHSEYETKLEKYASRYKENIRNTALELHCRDRQIPLSGNPLLMGILNINDDSFAGDGRLDADWALARAVEMVAEGSRHHRRGRGERANKSPAYLREGGVGPRATVSRKLFQSDELGPPPHGFSGISSARIIEYLATKRGVWRIGRRV
jgi:hypothetical protein